MKAEKLGRSKRLFEESPSAAKRYIDLYHQVALPDENQRLMLARAYYTLASQADLSLNRCKMHANTAITLLQNIQKRNDTWESQIAHAYFKRAELLEEENDYLSATLDYGRAIKALDQAEANHHLVELDRLLLAQCTISIAALIVHDEIDIQKLGLNHALFYINKCLENLSLMTGADEEIFIMQAYAHQIAGIALSQTDYTAAQNAFRLALFMAYRAGSARTYLMLSDIYNCMGLLLEQQLFSSPIHLDPHSLREEASVYFGLSLIFSTIDGTNMDEEDYFDYEQLFDIIYRVLDPFLPQLSEYILHDLIDALMALYTGLLENTLPNQPITRLLQKDNNLIIFLQHFYWLIIEDFRRVNKEFGLLEISDPDNVDLSLDIPNIIATLENKSPDNIHYLDYAASARSFIHLL